MFKCWLYLAIVQMLAIGTYTPTNTCTHAHTSISSTDLIHVHHYNVSLKYPSTSPMDTHRCFSVYCTTFLISSTVAWMWESHISLSNSLSWSAVIVSVSFLHLRAKARRRALSVAEQWRGGWEWGEGEGEEGDSLEWYTTDCVCVCVCVCVCEVWCNITCMSMNVE